MAENVWESSYFDAYDKVLLNSDIYLAVRDFHVNSMAGCKTVLDSGAGTGNVTLELAKRGCTVYAADKSRKALNLLKSKCTPYAAQVRAIGVNAEELPFPGDSFNGITSMFVIHFIGNLEAYLAENYRVLKKGGIFAITGRNSGENMGMIVDSYEGSLKKRGLLPELSREMELVREYITKSVSTAVKGRKTKEEIKSIFLKTGFRDLREFPNPYFGQCYSIIARK